MIKHVFIGCLFFFLSGVNGLLAQASAPADGNLKAEVKQDPSLLELAQTISQADLHRHLSTLASAPYQGRETGTEGQKKAGAYLAAQLASMGLKPAGDSGFFQPIAFINENWTRVKLSVDGKELRHLWDFYAYPSTNPNQDSFSTRELLFLGYGIEDKKYSDYAGKDVRGKVLLLLDGEPLRKDSTSLLTGSMERSEWSTDWRRKLRLAREKGARAVLIIDRQFQKNLQDARKVILNSGLQFGAGEDAAAQYLPNVFISSTVARKLIGENNEVFAKVREKMEKKRKLPLLSLPVQLSVDLNKWSRTLNGENVVGLIEGSDPQRKNEFIVVSAHYDHLGSRGESIYFGADDNASGTSAVLEIAEALAIAQKAGKGPRRSVLILLVSGEEKGLLGSYYFVRNPLVPLQQVVANVNVDMVGRVDEAHQENPNYIYVIGADRLSTELHQINEQANATYTGLELDYTYNAEDDPNQYYYRSDHYNFAKEGIPAIFYFNGTHEDYHRTTDTIDKIHFEKMEKVTRLIFYTTWQLADQEKRIEVDVQKK